ncbi:hypothetical protein N0B51_06485 [Tsuneonella sp. YG55]|uniref:Uncharacterized protein n=1 Tax=Tsuneonella litorea TaxID=2976475 RepID=A0A9X2W0G2_9SPHN|nr:hypothetical protein [Tsuneonella litorea]MCT2558623.1 hypothetical protein [Tsuneonella litorea]
MKSKRSVRFELNMHAACRVPATPMSAIILNLSVDGCRGRSRCFSLSRGATIIMKLASGDEMAG